MHHLTRVPLRCAIHRPARRRPHAPVAGSDRFATGAATLRLEVA